MEIDFHTKILIENKNTNEAHDAHNTQQYDSFYFTPITVTEPEKPYDTQLNLIISPYL